MEGESAAVDYDGGEYSFYFVVVEFLGFSCEWTVLPAPSILHSFPLVFVCLAYTLAPCSITLFGRGCVSSAVGVKLMWFRYRSIADRLLRLRLVPLTKSHPHHLLSYEFLNRQLTWTSLTEFLLFILPLILPSYRRLRRRLLRSIARTSKPTTKSTESTVSAASTLPTGSIVATVSTEATEPAVSKESIGAHVSQDSKASDSALAGHEGIQPTGELSHLPVRFCAICYKQGREGHLITNPYTGPCQHVYCYSCLLGEVVGEEGDGWPCLRCGYIVKRIERWGEMEGGSGVEDGLEGEREAEGAEGTEIEEAEEVEEVEETEELGEESEEVDDEEDVEQGEEEENLFSRR